MEPPNYKFQFLNTIRNIDFINNLDKEELKIVNETLTEELNNIESSLIDIEEDDNLGDKLKAFTDNLNFIKLIIKNINEQFKNNFEEICQKINLLEKKIHLISQDTFVLLSNPCSLDKLMEPFIELNPPKDLSLTDTLLPCTIESLGKNLAGGIWSLQGEGPRLAGKIYGIMVTILQSTKPFSIEEILNKVGNPTIKKMIKEIATPGIQLRSNLLMLCNLILLKGLDVYFIDDFLKNDAKVINNLQIYAIQEKINLHVKKILSEENPEKPIYIPFVINKGEGPLERNHIVLILIKDKKLEFYDPRGVKSEKIMTNNYSLKNILDYLAVAFEIEDQNIIENTYCNQFDSHSCGVFVALYTLLRLVYNKPPNFLNGITITQDYLNKFRLKLAGRLAVIENEILQNADFTQYQTPRIDDEEQSIDFVIPDDEF